MNWECHVEQDHATLSLKIWVFRRLPGEVEYLVADDGHTNAHRVPEGMEGKPFLTFGLDRSLVTTMADALQPYAKDPKVGEIVAFLQEQVDAERSRVDTIIDRLLP